MEAGIAENETTAGGALNETITADAVDEELIQLIFDGIFDVFVPLYFYSCILGFALLFFGYAIHKGWNDDLTPRVANRPANILKNAIHHHLPKWMSTPILYPVTWIGWAYYLTYDECIKGIPGTGTRKNGNEGPLLKTNLDAIIMLRFHTFMFKVGVLVFVLCTFVILPVNWTAGCDIEYFGNGTCFFREVNQTFFARTTIANIPDQIYNPTNEMVNITFQAGDLLLGLNQVGSNATFDDAGVARFNSSINFLEGSGQRIRVFATTISCVLIYLYTLYLLKWQWIENIALRRKYFLEATLYSKRTKELNKLAIQKKEIDNLVMDDHLNETTLESDQALASRLRQERMNENKNRPEHLTHPEITETPPGIGIFSVLYQLPRSMVTYDTDGATTLERQLVATTNFFDEIVPPESGFSSSVAAVTILPNAKLLAKARAKWEICEKRAQKLRYTRKKLQAAIKKQREYEQNERERQRNLCRSTPEAPSVKQSEIPLATTGQLRPTTAMRVNPDGSVESYSSGEKSVVRQAPPQEDEKNTPEIIEILSKNEGLEESPSRRSVSVKSTSTDLTITKDTSRKTSTFRYEDFNVSEYASSIGFHEEVHDMRDFVNGMDIEELNVFAYECAMLAGSSLEFDKKIYRLYGIETLRELEADLVEELRVANQELLEARRDVVAIVDENDLKDPPEQPSMPCDDDDSIIEQYGACEVTGDLAIGIRKRKKSSINDTSSSFGLATSRHTRRIIEENDSGYEAAIKSERSIMQRLWAPFQCILRIPRRIYRGIEGGDEWREPLKYYGMKGLVDTESGRKGYVTNLYHPSYAVVTFTTRHAAVIARQCLSDGAPQNHWKNADDMPFYPLADAHSLDIASMMPVTPTISYTSKKFRRWIVYTIMTAFTIAFTYIVQLINRIFLNPKLLSTLLGISMETATDWSIVISGLTQSLVFSICPLVFELLANIEGSATSLGKREQKALINFWYFYLVARYMGQIVWEAVVNFWYGDSVESAINMGITELARTIPTTLGPSAFSYTLSTVLLMTPLYYFLQLATLSTKWLRLRFLNRYFFKEGGPGPETPYRLYVDGGYTFAHMTALAPLCPILGTSCLLYFIIMVPMLRWLLVFVWRPRFDGGGIMWPRLHTIIITSLLLGQVVTSISLFLKQNNFQGFFIGFWIIPTLLFNTVLLERYRRPYEDAALLQTRRMYSNAENSAANAKSSLLREEYRRWLVDCHKASYLPTCLSGGKENLLTSEPAVVTSEGMVDSMPPSGGKDGRDNSREKERESARKLLKRQQCQKGGILRRQKFNL